MGADLLENLVHGALGVQLGAEGLAGGPELFQGWILAGGRESRADLGLKSVGLSLEGVSRPLG